MPKKTQQEYNARRTFLVQIIREKIRAVVESKENSIQWEIKTFGMLMLLSSTMPKIDIFV